MADTTNDIDALIEFLATASQVPFYYTYNAEKYHAALTALVAERDALKRRVAELESQLPADRNRDLRERLVCAALTGMLANRDFSHGPEDMGDWAARYADAALAAMRKGEGMSDPTNDIDGLVECIGNGTDGSGCGEVLGRSGYACGRCGGMLLSKISLKAADELAAMRKGDSDGK